MSAKAESIAQCGSYSSFLGLIESEVQLGIKGWVVVKMVYGRRNHIVYGALDAGNGFDDSGCSQAMPSH